MIPVKCVSPACKMTPENFRKTFQVDALSSPCPSCGEKGYLLACEFIHLIVPDRFGHMESKRDGNRYRFVCGYANQAYKKPSNTPGFPRMYTTNLIACTCPMCLKEFGAVEVNGELILQ